MFLFASVCLMSSATAQDTTFFDVDWEISTKDHAVFYRTFNKENKQWVVRDHFLSNDQVQMLGYYESKKMEKRTGKWTRWHENGRMSSIHHYHQDLLTSESKSWDQSGHLISSGQYEADERTGEWSYWYPNGQMKSIVEFAEEKKYVHFWQANGEQILTKGEGKIIELHPNGSTFYEGSIKRYKRIGKWEVFYSDGQKMEEVYFDPRGLAVGLHQYWQPNGKIEWSGERRNGIMAGTWTLYNQDGEVRRKITFQGTKNYSNPVYQFGERPPIPLNMAEVRQDIGYPETARRQGQEGVVIVRVFVDKQGNYVSHTIVDYFGKTFLKTVEKYIDNLSFLPAIRQHEKIVYYVNIPFNFKLLD